MIYIYIQYISIYNNILNMYRFSFQSRNQTPDSENGIPPRWLLRIRISVFFFAGGGGGWVGEIFEASWQDLGEVEHLLLFPLI